MPAENVEHSIISNIRVSLMLLDESNKLMAYERAIKNKSQDRDRQQGFNQQWLIKEELLSINTKAIDLCNPKKEKEKSIPLADPSGVYLQNNTPKKPTKVEFLC